MTKISPVEKRDDAPVASQYIAVKRGAIIGLALAAVVFLWLIEVVLDFIGEFFSDLAQYTNRKSDKIIKRATDATRYTASTPTEHGDTPPQVDKV